jgi:hypothetical protein
MKIRAYKILVLFLLSNAVANAQDAVTKGKELFGDLRARHIGPALMSGRISDIELHPTNDRVTLYRHSGGGVWKSSNGGATVNSIFDEHCQSIRAR